MSTALKPSHYNQVDLVNDIKPWCLDGGGPPYHSTVPRLCNGVEMRREFIVTVKKNHQTCNEVSLTKGYTGFRNKISFPFFFFFSFFRGRSVRPGFKFETDADTFAFHVRKFDCLLILFLNSKL